MPPLPTIPGGRPATIGDMETFLKGAGLCEGVIRQSCMYPLTVEIVLYFDAKDEWKTRRMNQVRFYLEPFFAPFVELVILRGSRPEVPKQ